MKLMKRATALLLCFLMLTNGPISAFATESVSDNDVVVETTTTTETVEVCEECGESDAHTETCSFNIAAPLTTETPDVMTGSAISTNLVGCTECNQTEGHLETCSQYIEETTEAPVVCELCGQSGTHAIGCFATFTEVNKVGYFVSDSVTVYKNPIQLPDDTITLSAEQLPESFTVQYSFPGNDGVTWYMLDTENWNTEYSEYGYVNAADVTFEKPTEPTDPEVSVGAQTISVSGATDLNATVIENNALSELDIADGLTGYAYDISALMSGNTATVTIKNAGSEGDSAMVLHFLHDTDEIIKAISDKTGWIMETSHASLGEEQQAAYKALGMEGAVVFEPITATVNDGAVTFVTDSFSTYYVVSGHNDTLKSWWQDSSGGTTEDNTRYNLDLDIYSLDATSETEKTFVVEPDSSFYMWVKNVETATWTITENKANGHITIESVANDSVGKVIRVSGTAAAGESLTFTAGGVTVTIQVDASVITDTFDLPIYIGIVLDPTDSGYSVANEPRVSGNDTYKYVYIKDPATLNSLVAENQNIRIDPVTGASASQYLKTTAIEGVLDKFLPGTDDKSVTGLIGLDMDTDDENHDDAIDLGGNKYENIKWNEIATALVTAFGSSSQLKATDGETVNGSNSYMYELRPYVIKVQTSKHVGWHINACFVPKDNQEDPIVWVNYDENLPAGAKVEYMNVPLRTPLKGTSGYESASSIYMVEPTKSSGDTNAYNRISESEYITLADGRKLRFVGWNTRPDGSGCHVGLGGSLNIQSCSNHTGDAKHDSLENGGTLYAFWSDISERLEVHKVLQIDGTDDRHSKQNFNFKVTLTLPENYQFEANKDKFLIELFNVSDDSYVANSKKDANMATTAVTMDISFNEDQYAVIYAPVGTQYKVEEVAPTSQDYKLVGYQNNEGTIQGLGKDPNVIVTNSYKSTKGYLNVSKTVAVTKGELTEELKEQLFEFTVSVPAPEGKTNNVEFTLYNALSEQILDTQQYVVLNENGTYTVWLKHGWHITFSGLEAGTNYSVTETAVTGYTTTPQNANGTIAANVISNAAFTNTYEDQEELADLTITKTGWNTTDENQSFLFDVTGPDGFQITVTINGEGSVTIKDLPIGEYTVTENTDWSWRYTPTDGASKTITLVAGGKNEVTFANKRSWIYWLSGDSYCENWWGGENGTVTKRKASN